MRKKTLFITIILICSTLLLVGSNPALASVLGKFDIGYNEIVPQLSDFGLAPGTTTPLQIITNIVKALLTLVGILFIGMLVFGGWQYMTSQGSDDKIKKAKNLIKSSVVGFLIIMGSYTLTLFIAVALEGGPGQGQPNFNQACEETDNIDFWTIPCCEYRLQLNGVPDVRCCTSYSTFCSANQAKCTTAGATCPAS